MNFGFTASCDCILFDTSECARGIDGARILSADIGSAAMFDPTQVTPSIERLVEPFFYEIKYRYTFYLRL